MTKEIKIPMNVPILGEKKMIKALHIGQGEDGKLYIDDQGFNNLEIIEIGNWLIENGKMNMRGMIQ